MPAAGYFALPTSANPNNGDSPNLGNAGPPTSFRNSRVFAALYARSPAALHPVIEQLEKVLARPRTARFVALIAGGLVVFALISLTGIRLPSGRGITSGWGSGMAGDSARGKWGSSGGLHSWDDVKGNQGLVEPVLEVDERTGYTMPPEVYPAALNP